MKLFLDARHLFSQPPLRFCGRSFLRTTSPKRRGGYPIKDTDEGNYNDQEDSGGDEYHQKGEPQQRNFVNEVRIAVDFEQYGRPHVHMGERIFIEDAVGERHEKLSFRMLDFHYFLNKEEIIKIN